MISINLTETLSKKSSEIILEANALLGSSSKPLSVRKAQSSKVFKGSFQAVEGSLRTEKNEKLSERGSFFGPRHESEKGVNKNKNAA